ncbi:MAG: hypothetical protein ACT6Q6_18990, partial [Hydrogenophaga sp.]
PVPTTTQTIGGNVSGLAGTVVLRNNGADDLAVNTDGPFTFPTPVATGVPYNVTVGTQPAGQTCTVQNGSGTANADVNNVAVNCTAGATQAWQGAALIESNDVARAFNPVVATDSQGNAFAVWAQGNGTFDNIWAARYTPGGGWGAPQVIDDHSGNATEPRIAVDSAGNAVAIWVRENIVSHRGLVAASYTAGTWGAAEVLSGGGTDNSARARVAMNANGTATAVWQESLADGLQTWA